MMDADDETAHGLIKYGLLPRVNSQPEKSSIELRHDVGKRRLQPGCLLRFFLFLAQPFGEKSLFLVEAEAVFGFNIRTDRNK